MIRFALTCDQGHGFDAWFSSGDSYDEQLEAGAIICPTCGSDHVEKAPMAPAVLRGRAKETAHESPACGERKQTYAFLKDMRDYLKANADDVARPSPRKRARCITARRRPATSMARPVPRRLRRCMRRGFQRCPCRSCRRNATEFRALPS